jgi:hypothetical protein
LDSAIVAAIIGAAGVIVAALIAVWAKSRDRQKETRDRSIFLLGTNTAKLGWSKFGAQVGVPTPGSENVLVMTRAILRELDLPTELQTELENFLQTNDLTTSDIRERLPGIRDLFGVTIAAKFGNRALDLYNVGFNLINIVLLCELASLKVDEAGPVAIEALEGIVAEAERLQFPTAGLRSILARGRLAVSDRNGEAFDTARNELLRVGDHYLRALE